MEAGLIGADGMRNAAGVAPGGVGLIRPTDRVPAA